LSYYNKSLKIYEKLQHRVEMAKDYRNIGNAFGSMGDREQAIESCSKGLEILRELEEETGYHDPFSDIIQGSISELEQNKDSEG
jgi:tetratricopeptide (TPR) repeat protein